MSRIIFVSSLLPYKIQKVSGKGIKLHNRTGGFQSGLRSFYEEHKSAWLGWTGTEVDCLSEDEISESEKLLKKFNCYPLQLTLNEMGNYLKGFCNHTLWPIFHYFPQKAVFIEEEWQAYIEVNRKYAEKLKEIIEPGDKLWIHDYHLMLLPGMLRENYPDLSIGYFQHIPFPSFEIFRLLPWRTEILDGLLGADLIAFHTYDYQRHFMSCVTRLEGLETFFNQIRLEKRVLKVENFPMGIDFIKFHEQALRLANDTPENKKPLYSKIQKHIKQNGKTKVILSIDRLDYTKGISNRLIAIRSFFTTYPEYKEKISLLLFVVPSRESMPDYQKLKSELDELVGNINSEFGTIDWKPVHYFYRSMEFSDLTQVYLSSDIALITPLRDGMNLIAKEYIACKPDQKGVLILSEMAGAAKEMGETIIINPNNPGELVEAIKKAVDMPEEEQIKINKVLQKRLSRYNEEKWANDFVSSLAGVKKLQEYNSTRRLSQPTIIKIAERYKDTAKRIIFLDYDGTLQGFFKDPQKAGPDEELYEIIDKLTSDKKNKVVIISGRDKETLEGWFKNRDRLEFIAEHGVWNKSRDDEWKMMESIDKSWMDVVRPHLEFFVDRTPNSFIEDKNYSLVWHYRKVDPDLGLQRSWELKDELTSLLSNLHLEIMDGDMVIEIKNAGINKGRAALMKMNNENWDFIMALGDDWTDEFTFEAMPEEAITIKVGEKRSKANYFIDSYLDVRKLLRKLVGDRVAE